MCTRDFKTSGLVLRYTSEYLEIRWSGPEGIEKVPTEEIDDILRVAHAGDISPDGKRTNLEMVQVFESLENIRTVAANRTFKNDQEKSEADNLVRRSFAEGGCPWDKQNAAQLLSLALQPETVGVTFKLRERLHRLFCSRSH